VQVAFVVILFSDLVGSTSLFDHRGDEVADRVRREHFSAMRDAIAAHEGREVKSTGDGLMVAFASAVGALRCAVEMQRATTGSEGDLRLRVGLDGGEPLAEGDDLYGTPVIVASRLCAAAGPGEILASELVSRIAAPRVSALIGPTRTLRLKGIEEPVLAAQIRWQPRRPVEQLTVARSERRSGDPWASHEDALLDREYELGELDALIDAIVVRAARLQLIEGPAGIGKTMLMRYLCRRGAVRGLRVVTARGGELERDFGFGIVRQLFDTLLVPGHRGEDLFAGAAELARPVFDAAPGAAAEDVSHSVLHGLYWFVVNLSEASPVMLAVDDVHWADQPSLRFLIHLARRLEGLPVGIAIASRPEDSAADDELQRALRAEAPPPILRLDALSGEASTQLVKAHLGIDANPELCAACGEASGGNPFLLSELLEELRGRRSQRGGLDPRRVREIGPERIASALLMRIGSVDDEAPALAQAVAVLGARTEIEQARALAGIQPERARAVSAALRDAGIFERDEPLRFVYPIVRTAIYEDIAAPLRTELHRRAATLLTRTRAGPETVGIHLLATDPLGEEWVVATLRAAAETASARGAPEAAAGYLRRALREPPTDESRAGLLLALGRTEQGLGLPEAQAHLREAVEVAGDPRSRADAVHALGWVIGPDPDAQRELITLYEDAAAAVRGEDRELAMKLEERRLAALTLLPDHSPRFDDEAERFRDLAGDTPAECALLGFCTRKLLLAGEPADAVAELAARAAQHLDLTEPGAHSVWLTSTILWLPDRVGLLQAFERRVSDAIAAAAKRGWATAFAWNSTLRAFIGNLTGNLRGAEADARAALDSGGLSGPHPDAPVMPLVESLAEQGKTAEADALLRERGLIGDLPPMRPYAALLVPRARMHTVAGDLDAARRDLDEALRRLEQSQGGRAISGLDARLEAALIGHALGDTERARQLSDEALELANTWGAERAVGGALWVAGVLRGGKQGVDLLGEAVQALALSPAAIWHARAVVDLGAAQRRAGQRSRARERLAEGMDLAHRYGAKPLVDRAHDELVRAGARPRRVAQSGLDALTPSERRAAELAAEGRSNKQIAQALFVTLRTVEMHLSAAYRKLGIDSRLKLPDALTPRS
jgi:class 3 adenylate cyclase/DNA-binding CsgD family transcriptional regulator